MFIRLLAKTNNNVPEGEIERNIVSEEKKKKVQYISNGRTLNDVSAFCYYVFMLDLEGAKQIDDETIKSAAYKRYMLRRTIDYKEEWPVAPSDIKAARDYLLDRWMYMTSYN